MSPCCRPSSTLRGRRCRRPSSLTTIYVLVATLIHSAIVVLAGTLEPFLNDPSREKIARRIAVGAACLRRYLVWLVDGQVSSYAASARHFAHVPRNSITAFLATKPVEPIHWPSWPPISWSDSSATCPHLSQIANAVMSWP